MNPDKLIDQGLRLVGYLCFAACLYVVYLIAPLYAPRPNQSEAVLMDKCLVMKGFPVFDGYTGQMEGCER